LTDYIDDETLAVLIKGCAAFAYVSIYEGFGLPVLEAMALGAPVVTSNNSSLPEVAGDAALLVDPFSPEAIAGALHRLLTDADLARDLRARGARQEQRFSWERTAGEHLRLYHEVAGS
jgi:glycosyltransferase involved in cell wall biosynthesis